MIDRAEVRKISPAMLAGLKIETAALSFRIDGFDRVARASGFLKLRRGDVALDRARGYASTIKAAIRGLLPADRPAGPLDAGLRNWIRT